MASNSENEKKVARDKRTAPSKVEKGMKARRSLQYPRAFLSKQDGDKPFNPRRSSRAGNYPSQCIFNDRNSTQESLLRRQISSDPIEKNFSNLKYSG